MYVKARVRAGAKKEEVVVLPDNRFEILVKQKPIQNLANRRVVELVAAHFHIPVEKVRIISGHHSPSKILSVE
ncbi:MAG: DUF167 domain-containing protein [bacterium]|nr:DUF167 domain-containing protein [bacterium]